MKKFSWFKAIGLGVLIWLVMFALLSAAVGFGASMSSGWSISFAVLSGILGFVAAVYTGADRPGVAFGYGAVWLAAGVVLDLLITRQFNASVFSSWIYWMGYALVLLAPWAELELRRTMGTAVKGS